MAHITDLALTDIIDKSVKRIKQNNRVFLGRFPSYGDRQMTYHLTANENWLAAFWSGLLWLAAAKSKSPTDIQAACERLPSFAQRLDKRIHLNHDLGFLFLLSARAQWQFTSDEQAHALALRAADLLLARFHTSGGYIQAWHDTDHPSERGRFIIDCMMNLPLLFWASRETRDQKYWRAAMTHALTSARYLLRDGGETYHTYFMDADTGEPIGPKTHQGYADESLWSRGQAWAIYGFTMAAEWTGDDAFTRAAVAAAGCYRREAPPKAISRWDYALPEDAPAHPDSSADAIAASGLLRLAEHTGESEYRQLAMDRIKILVDQAFETHPNAQGLLRHGTQHAPHGYGVDTYTIFGDYFFLEALMKLNNEAPDFWGPDAK
jgi:unsaturated chondroitin disaccharide hydrolase